MNSYAVVVTAAAQLLAAPGTGKAYRIWGYQIMGKATDATVSLQSGATNKAFVLTPSSGVGGISCPPGREPYFDCNPNDALNVSLGGATGSVAVNVQYSILSTN